MHMLLVEKNRFVENRAFSITVDSKDEDTVYDKIKKALMTIRFNLDIVKCVWNWNIELMSDRH